MQSRYFKINRCELSEGDMQLCAILNITPDSFSDGGKYNTVPKALDHAKTLVQAGATMLDIGGESTRPGSKPVPSNEEIARICPVIEAIRQDEDLKTIPLSVDTFKSKTADAALSAGADIVNDVTGLLADANMATVVAKHQAGLITMFNPILFRPDHPASKNFTNFGSFNLFSIEEKKEHLAMPILEAMTAYFRRSLTIAEKHGIPKEQIMLDPGIGFGLTKKENLLLIQHIEMLHDMGYCSFLGVSRKRFITDILNENNFSTDKESAIGLNNIDIGSSYISAIAALKGVNVVRVHDIEKHKMARAIAEAIKHAEREDDKVFGRYKK